jgi:hypothetical protein
VSGLVRDLVLFAGLLAFVVFVLAVGGLLVLADRAAGTRLRERFHRALDACANL